MDSRSDAPSQGSADELYFTTHNPTAPTTVILLHGMFASHREWDYVIPHLSDYHLIVPDFPHHSRSRHIAPFTIRRAAAEVAKLIQNHAHGRVAHVVGLSLGGFVTLELIRRHPETVTSAFVTGSAPCTEWQIWFAQRPKIIRWGLWAIMNSGIYQASAWYAGLLEHEDLKAEILANCTLELAKSANHDISVWGLDEAREVAKQDKRILVAAGENGDPQDKAKELASVLQEGGVGDGKDTRAYVVKNAIHGWDLQLPELFATAIKAWIGRQPLPSEFSEL